jgi:hypothetical protein
MYSRNLDLCNHLFWGVTVIPGIGSVPCPNRPYDTPETYSVLAVLVSRSRGIPESRKDLRRSYNYQ